MEGKVDITFTFKFYFLNMFHCEHMVEDISFVS